jgi:hypothetical protein
VGADRPGRSADRGRPADPDEIRRRVDGLLAHLLTPGQDPTGEASKADNTVNVAGTSRS